MVLVAQVALLAHIDEINETEAESVEECEICLLLSGLDDFIAADAASDAVPVARFERLDHSVESPSLPLPAPQARGPPRA